MTLRTFLYLLLLTGILCISGCMIHGPAGSPAPSPSDTSAQSAAKYKQTLAQPEESAEMIRMDTDIYNLGEVVEFVVANDRNQDLSCSADPPSFSVRYQMAGGRWITRMGEENPPPGNTTRLKAGESTGQYRFVTGGWAPGRYRIVSDCGVSREILLRALPAGTPARPACPPGVNVSPYIRVNPISDQYAGTPFTISGTTNLATGEELRYSIFAIRSGTVNITAARLVSSEVAVSAGSCGVNTWSVDGMIEIPGDYFIGISGSANPVSGVRRFTVLPQTRTTTTPVLPATTNPPGITSTCRCRDLER